MSAESNVQIIAAMLPPITPKRSGSPRPPSVRITVKASVGRLKIIVTVCTKPLTKPSVSRLSQGNPLRGAADAADGTGAGTGGIAGVCEGGAPLAPGPAAKSPAG